MKVENKVNLMKTPKLLKFENLLMGIGIFNALMVFLASGSKGIITCILSLAIPLGIKVLIDIRNHLQEVALTLKAIKVSQSAEISELVSLKGQFKNPAGAPGESREITH